MTTTLSPIRRILKGAAFLGGAQMIRTLVRALYMVVLARYLGAELFGRFNYGLGWYLAFMSISYLGFDLILGKEDGAREERKADSFVAATLRVQLIVSMFAAFLSGLAALLVEAPEIIPVLAVFSVALIGRSVSAWCGFVFTAKQKFNKVFWMETACRLLEAAVGTVALLLGAGLFEAVLIHTLFWWVQAAWGLWELSAARLLMIPISVSRLVSRIGDAPIILGIAGIAQTWLAQAPVVMYRLLGGNDASLGQVALAFQVFGLLAGLSWTVVRAVLPDLSRSVREGGTGDVRFVERLVQTTIVGVGALTALANVVGAPFLEFVFGQQYAVAGSYLPYVIAASAFYTLGVASHQVLVSHGRQETILYGTLTGTGISTLVMIIAWQWTTFHASIISLACGLLAWVLVTGRIVHQITAFSIYRVVVFPTLTALTSVLAVDLVSPVSNLLAVICVLTIFSSWLWYWKPFQL